MLPYLSYGSLGNPVMLLHCWSTAPARLFVVLDYAYFWHVHASLHVCTCLCHCVCVCVTQVQQSQFHSVIVTAPW